MEKELQNKIESQKEYAKLKGFPHFAPNSGNCWKCHKQIYDKITLEKASSELIIGCPHCNWSYCE